MLEASAFGDAVHGVIEQNEVTGLRFTTVVGMSQLSRSNGESSDFAIRHFLSDQSRTTTHKQMKTIASLKACSTHGIYIFDRVKAT